MTSLHVRSHPEIGSPEAPLAAFVSQTFLTFDDFKESWSGIS